MGENNFVARLTASDFLEFARENFSYQNFEYATIISGGIEECRQVLFHHNKNLKKKRQDQKRVFFYPFYYVEGMADFDCVFLSKNNYWREFLASKFGEEYVTKYKEYMDVYIIREERKMEDMRRSYICEINRLMRKYIE